MPGSNVSWPIPLTRLTPFYPGQMGVPGTDSDRGLRTNSEGCIFYVDPNHVDPNDNRDGTNPDSPLNTVAAALLKCQPYRGDVIAVMANNAWGYGNPLLGYATPISEEVIVNVPGVRIVGVSPSAALGVVWTPASNAGVCITVNASDVTIEGFIFTDGAFTGVNGIYALWNGTTAFGDNLTVRHCGFDECTIGIQLEFSWYCDIHDCHFYGDGSGQIGIYVDPAGSGSAFNTIWGNWFQDCEFAISMQDTDSSNITGNHIYNQVAAHGGVAATGQGIDLTGGQENIVSHNWLSCVLPVPAVGDYDDFNTAGTDDAWINNFCMNGPTTTNPT